MKIRELANVTSDVLRTIHITVEDLRDVLRHMKVDKSNGPNQIYPRMLCEAR